MTWSKQDLSQYNKAPSPWYRVSDNGKVDINAELGDSEKKISLQPWGMYKLMHDWLKSNHGLDEEQRTELIDLLSRK